VVLIILSVAVSYLLWQNHIYTTEKIKQKVRAEQLAEASAKAIARIKCKGNRSKGNRNCEMIEPGRPRGEMTQLLIIVCGTNEIYMDGRRVDVRQVKTNVLKLLAPQGTVVIQADETASADAIIQVMDGARDAGVYDTSLAADRTPTRCNN
tara:strand:+ start:44 stop:496 length:453 start_codon:yes stop_codon:yes gene_type:complete